MFDEARHSSLLTVFRVGYEGYISVVPRLISHAAAVFPIGYTALVGSTLTSLVWLSTAIGSFWIIKSQTSKTYLALLASLMVVLVPAGKESSLGNSGNAKWQVFILLVLVTSSKEFIGRFPKTTLFVTFLSGFSHPLSLIAVIPVIHSSFGTDANVRRISRMVLGLSFVIFVIQLFAFRISGANPTRVVRTSWYWHWSGFFSFWNFNFIVPLMVCVTVALLGLSIRLFAKQATAPAALVALTGFVIGIVSYRQGNGLTDRYFVAPTVLGWISLIQLVGQTRGRLLAACRSVMLVVGVVLLWAVVTWFRSSSYINSGPTWHSEIRRLRQVCNDIPTEYVEAQLSIGVANVRCGDLAGMDQ